MKIIGFVEGAHLNSGGVGLIGVPKIWRAVAGEGHHIVLAIGGGVIPGAEQFLSSSIEDSFEQERQYQRFNVITSRPHGRWSFAPSLLPRLSRYSKDADFFVLHSLYSFPVLAGYLFARWNNKPYGLYLHGVLAPFQRSVSAGKKRVYNSLIGNRILNEASVLFFTAAGERDETRSLNLIAPSVVVPLGIELDEYGCLPRRGCFRAEYLDASAGAIVLYLGRLNAKKGLDLLIKAFALVASQAPEARLVIAGSGDPPEFEDRVRRWVLESGIVDRVIFTGLLTGQKKLQVLADADILVVPSHAENFCFAMFEAMACRIPVVISDTLNLAGEVKDHGAGIAVPRDPQAFASAILSLLRDRGRQQQMGDNGYSLARLYSWERTGRGVVKTIQCILRGLPLPDDLTPNA